MLQQTGGWLQAFSLRHRLWLRARFWLTSTCARDSTLQLRRYPVAFVSAKACMYGRACVCMLVFLPQQQ